MTKPELEVRVAELEAENATLKEIVDDMQKTLEEEAARKAAPSSASGKPEVEHKGRTLVVNIRRFILENRGEVTFKQLQNDEALIDEILAIDGQQILTFKP